MTVNQLKPHICVAFSKLPENSYLHLNEAYEIDSVDRREIHMHSIQSGAPIIQLVARLRDTHFYLA